MISYPNTRRGKPGRQILFHLLLSITLVTAPRARAADLPPAHLAPASYAYQAAPPGIAATTAADSGARAKRWYEGNLLRAAVVPAVLIGYGVSVRGNHGLYSSQDARRDVRRAFGDFHSGVDDGLLLVPYAELAALSLFRIPGRHDRLNTALLVAKSTTLALATFSVLKFTVRDWRPDGSNNQSFPSGHTAIAFCAASLVHQEFRARSQWPGVAAYAVATSVGAMRMINDRHWQADVLAGAGIGILSVHAAYLTHRYRWGRRPTEGPGTAAPRVGMRWAPWVWPGAGAGFSMAVTLP